MKIKYLIIASLVMTFGQHSLNAQSVSKEQTSYLQAKELYDKGLYSASRLAFEKHMQAYEGGSSISEASYFRAISAVRLSQEDGEALVQNYVQSYPNDSHAASAYVELAEYYYDRKAYAKAISFYENTNPGSTQSDLIKFKIGHAYFVEKKQDKALTLFSSILSDLSLKNDAAYFQGYIYDQQNDNDKALEYLQQAFKSDSYGTEALKLYAVRLYEKGELKKVIAIIDQEAPGTDDKDLLKILGDANYDLQEYRLASLSYKEYLKKSKRTDAASYFKIGLCFYKLENSKGAVDNLKKAALAKDTVGAYASYYLGKLYTRDENLIFASTAFKNASKYSTEIKEESTFAHGKTEYDLENYQTVIPVFTNYNNEFPNGSHKNEVSDMLTQSYLNNKDYQAAIEYIESQGYLSTKMKEAYQRLTYQKRYGIVQ